MDPHYGLTGRPIKNAKVPKKVRNGAQKGGMMTRDLEHHFFCQSLKIGLFKVSYIRYSALQCHLAAAFCFIIKIYFIVSKTLLLPMSKDMNMKIIKTTTQLCSRFGAHPQYCAARAEMVLVQQCHRNRKTESSNIKYQTHIRSLKGEELFVSK